MHLSLLLGDEPYEIIIIYTRPKATSRLYFGLLISIYNVYTSQKAISRIISLVVDIMVGAYAKCSTGWRPRPSSMYIPTTNYAVSKYCMWVEVWGFGTLPVRSTSVRGRTTQLVAYPIPLLRHLTAFTAFALGSPLFFHASRGLMEVGKTLLELPSDHCWLRGFLGYGRTLLMLCCVSGSEVWKASAPLQVTCSFECKHRNSHAALLYFFNAVTMVSTIVLTTTLRLQTAVSLVALSPVSQSHSATPGKLTICSTAVLARREHEGGFV